MRQGLIFCALSSYARACLTFCKRVSGKLNPAFVLAVIFAYLDLTQQSSAVGKRTYHLCLSYEAHSYCA